MATYFYSVSDIICASLSKIISQLKQTSFGRYFLRCSRVV